MFKIKTLDVSLEFTEEDIQYVLSRFGSYEAEESNYFYVVEHNEGSDYWEIDYLDNVKKEDSSITYVDLSIHNCEDAVSALQNLNKQIVQEVRDFKNE